MLKAITQDDSMSRTTNRTITKRPDGSWENKKNSSERASSLHKTQKKPKLLQEEC
jgi:hypothetical protein